MSLTTTCPGCSASYQLAETMRGKKVRCKSCSEVFVVRGKTSAPDRDEDEERIQVSPRPAKRVAVREEEEDEDTGRLPERRRPRKKRGNSAAVPLMIVGGIAVGVLLLGLAGIAIWALSRARQPQPTPAVANANPPAPAAQPVQNPPPPNPAPVQGPLAVELSNGKVSGFGAQMQVAVDYRFTSGNPQGRRLFLVIKPTKTHGLLQNYYFAEMHDIGNRTRDTFRASGISFGIENGPFEIWMGEGPPGFGLRVSVREIRTISNVVTVAFKENTLPGMRPPFGPRRVGP